MQTVYEYLMKNGHGLNTALRYTYKGEENYQCEFDQDDQAGAVYDFVRVQPGNETLLKLALANIGPLAIAVDASLETFQNYQGGVYDDVLCSTKINHAVVLGNDLNSQI